MPPAASEATPPQRPYRRRNPAGSPRHPCTGTVTTCVRDAVFRAGGIADASGDCVVMAEADETYPIQELGPFVDRLEQGDDLVLGSRFKGKIHGDAMPWLNRRIGNPILTGLLNLFFGVKVSDAHCGMRAVRRDALRTLDLHSTGMEFASEMVFKAYRRDPNVSEIPIDYFPRV